MDNENEIKEQFNEMNGLENISEDSRVSEADLTGGTAQPAEEPSLEAEKKPGIADEIKEWIKDILVAVVVAFLILQFIKPTVVREHSMENTLHENDYLFVCKQSYKLFGGTPSCGDIIVFQSGLPNSKGGYKLLIKRIIAVPGDTIAIHDGIVYLNGEALDEPYTKDGYTLTEMEEVTVPEGYLFCMGDNRQNSADSRDARIGLVDVDTIMGKAVFRLFPLSKIGGLYE